MEFITVDVVREEMEKFGYICDDENLIWEAVNIVNSYNASSETRKGQDISAICLAGPPGSGKTEFAKVIYKIVQDTINKDCVLVSYQCDPTTGKEDLFEDINVTAVVKSDAAKVIVQGALLKAIKQVNENKKVILFLDEYDKAREETDSFLLQFLQSGEISTAQTSTEDAKILNKENKKNLQVILCKNDNRDKLSGPLERRLEFIYLKEMTPSVFYKVATKAYKDDTDLVNFVSLVYNYMYESKNSFERLPACAEMLDAIKHAKDYISWKAPSRVVYRKIFDCMVKTEEDRPTFINLLQKEQDKLGVNLASIYDKDNKEELPEVYNLVKQTLFKDYEQAFNEKMKEINALKEKVVKKGRFTGVKVSDKLKFVEQDVHSKIQGNFKQNGKVKRGVDITSGSTDWTLVATMEFNQFNKELYNDKLKALAETEENMVVYENGYRYMYNNGNYNLNVVCLEEDDKTKVNFYFDNAILPVKVYNEILSFAYQIYKLQNDADAKFTTECILHSNRNIESVEDVKKVGNNLYTIVKEMDKIDENFSSFAKAILSRDDKIDEKELKQITQDICKEE